MSRFAIALLVVSMPWEAAADPQAQPARGIVAAGAARPPRPVTEIDVYRDIAEFWILAGMDESVAVSGGGGHLFGGLGTFDVSLHDPRWRPRSPLLPTTLSSGVWVRDGEQPRATVPLALGWRLPLGLFSAPYLAADGVGAWTPSSDRLDAGFAVGLGYEWRASLRWAVALDARLIALWQLTGADDATSPVGGRAALEVRYYLGDFSFLEDEG